MVDIPKPLKTAPTPVPVSELTTVARRDYFAGYLLAGMVSSGKTYGNQEAVKLACDLAELLIQELDSRP